jgi:hypothetical protein
MTNVEYSLTVSVPRPGVLRFVLDGGPEPFSDEVSYDGPVDNALLTAVDNLFKRNTIDRSALTKAVAGEGIDKNSSLARIVESFASAVKVGRKA